MIMNLLTRNAPADLDPNQQRKNERRNCDQCVGAVNGKNYPVINWSTGGVLLSADERTFGMNDLVYIDMKFRVQDHIVDIQQSGRVVRKGPNRVAVCFDRLNETVRHKFQQIIDDSITREFADSQA